MRLLWMVDSALLTTSRRLQAAEGVTARERLVIRIIGIEPGLGLTLLARILVTHPSTLVPVLKRLEARGLVTRKHDASDQRRRLLFLTAAGKRIDALRKGTVEQVVGRVVGTLAATDLAGARRVLETAARELGR